MATTPVGGGWETPTPAPVPARTGSTPDRRRSSPKRRRRRLGLLFLAPALTINFLVIGGPALASTYYAFTDWTGFGAANFTGLDNLKRLLADETFKADLLHNAFYMVFFLTVPMIMGLAGAFMLSRITRFQMIFRILYFIPYLIASVVNAAVWKNILDPDAGIGPQLGKLGIHQLEGVYFLGDTKLSLPTVAFVDNWHFWGFTLILFLAAMQSVDAERYEAARVDGANAWQEFWHITLPGIRPTLVFALLLVSLWSLLAFDYPYALTGGGPAGSSELVSILVNRTAFGANEAGYAAFMGLAVCGLALFVIAVQRILRRRGWEI